MSLRYFLIVKDVKLFTSAFLKSGYFPKISNVVFTKAPYLVSKPIEGLPIIFAPGGKKNGK